MDELTGAQLFLISMKKKTVFCGGRSRSGALGIVQTFSPYTELLLMGQLPSSQLSDRDLCLDPPERHTKTTEG